ncbi:MAG: adenylate/guanylate cyclase domain-containing protein [Gammaproteobacteria bacterium]|nr:adenylate/guanylate cyclase domain-containing protein [Gammaproteobacteria bacterium]
MSSAAKKRAVRLLIRSLISGLLLLLFTLHIAGSPRLEIIERIENYLYDVRIRLTMPGTVDDRIVIIDIDEASQAELGQWPWPRNTLAALVDRLFDDYEIRVLGLDALFAEAEETSAERLLDTLAASEIGRDPAIATELARQREALDSNFRFAESFIARDVVTGFVFKDSLQGDEPVATGALPSPIITADAIADLSVPFITASGFSGNLPALQQNAVGGGFFDAPVIDADGVFRRAPLLQRFQGDLYPSLALAVARVALDMPDIGLAFAATKDGRMSGVELEALTIGERRIPVNEQVAVFIPFRGPQESFPYISAKDVLSGAAAADVLRGRIALLGASAAGLLDLRSTPVGQRYIGVEAHANLIAGLLDGAIRQQPAWSDGLEFSLLLLIALLTALLLPRLAPFAALALVFLLLAAAMASNLWMWSALGLVVPIASLLSFILIASMLQITYGFFVEQRNKRHLSQIFGQYIPPALVEEIDASGAQISLEGENREMSVLFSDVRSFTTISEGLDATELTRMMNEFLTPFTGVIQKYRGTIDKYMGDAVMAFWGAPLTDPQHARHALLAAFDMLRVVHELDQPFAARGWPKIRVGVGIASGPMNVGNMGSEFRIAYTVMGDTVNLGSRLEGLTKQYGVDIIVNDVTANQVPEFAFRELDLVRVKGKSEPVAIYEPIGLLAELSAGQQQRLATYAAALAAYRSRLWDDAETALTTLRQHSDELLYNVYLDRIGNFRQSPPPAGWDGVFAQLNK